MSSLPGGWARGGGRMLKASVKVGCRDAMLTACGEGLSGRVPQADMKASLQRGAMERSSASGPEILGLRRRHSSRLLDESSVLRYLRAWVSFGCRGNIIDGLAHWISLSSRKQGQPLGARPRIWDYSWTPWSHSGVSFC